MADPIDELIVRIAADTSDLKRGLEEAQKGAERTGESFTEMNQALELAKKGWELLAEPLAEAVRLFTESESASLRLNSILKATGGAAGQTSEELESLANSMAKNTIFDDDAMKNAEARMLTFKNVTGDTFKQAIRLSTDLASAFGTDLTSASNTLGRALDDPVNGLTALHRMGVTFTDDQKAQIKAFQDAGDIAKAQGVILENLQGKIGGVGQALRDSASGDLKKFQQAVEDTQKALGKSIAEGLAPFARAAADAMMAMLDTRSSSEKLTSALQAQLDKNQQLLATTRDILGPISQKNQSDKLTLEQYTQLIAAYPQLKGQVDAYSTTLKDTKAAIDAVADAERKRIKAQLEANDVQAFAAFLKESDAAVAAAKNLGLVFTATTDINSLRKQQYELTEKALAMQQKAADAGASAAELQRYGNLINSLQAATNNLASYNNVKGALNALSETGSLVIKKETDAIGDHAQALVKLSPFQQANADAYSKYSEIQTQAYADLIKMNQERDAEADKIATVTIPALSTLNRVYKGEVIPAQWESLTLSKEEQARAKQLGDTFNHFASGPFQALGDALVRHKGLWQAMANAGIKSIASLTKALGDALAAEGAMNFVKGLASAAQFANPAELAKAPGYFAAAGIEAAGAAAAWTAAGALNAIPAFADGTLYSPSGYALVGERGPEIVKLPQGSQVFNNQQTTQMNMGTHYDQRVTIVNPSQPSPAEQVKQFQQIMRAMAWSGGAR